MRTAIRLGREPAYLNFVYGFGDDPVRGLRRTGEVDHDSFSFEGAFQVWPQSHRAFDEVADRRHRVA